jgi:uncharacterized damage-inducible protein DinB
MTAPPAPPDGELVALRRLFRYIRDARAAYLESFAHLPPEVLEKDRGASFPSILDIFAHALVAFRSWIQFTYADRPPPATKRTAWTLIETRELTTEIDRLVDRFFSTLTASDLDRSVTFHWTSGDEGSLVTIKIRDILWHLVEEELQHRGEINALLWQQEIDAPILAWDDWIRTQP